MTALSPMHDSALLAGRILDALRSGNLPGLELELQRTRSAPLDLPPDSAERWELLDAVAGQMSVTLQRLRRPLHPPLRRSGSSTSASCGTWPITPPLALLERLQNRGQLFPDLFPSRRRVSEQAALPLQGGLASLPALLLPAPLQVQFGPFDRVPACRTTVA